MQHMGVVWNSFVGAVCVFGLGTEGERIHTANYTRANAGLARGRLLEIVTRSSVLNSFRLVACRQGSIIQRLLLMLMAQTSSAVVESTVE
jgi:hypothetical protein